MPVVITGNNTPTAGGVTYGDGTTYANTVAGSSGQLLQSNGASAPSWVTASSSALVFISSATASSSSTISFTGISSTYDAYMVELIYVRPASNTNLYLRTSSNGGSSYDSGATAYGYSMYSLNQRNATSFDYDNTSNVSGTTQILINGGTSMGSSTNQNGVSGFLYIFKPSATQYCAVQYSVNWIDSSDGIVNTQGVARRQAASAVNAIQFSMASGNIASGTFRLYGIANS
jgi:hypothetical protein